MLFGFQTTVEETFLVANVSAIDTVFFVESARTASIIPKRIIQIDEEAMFVKHVNGNSLTVVRASHECWSSHVWTA